MNCFSLVTNQLSTDPWPTAVLVGAMPAHSVGLAQGHSFTFPVTQTDIADCLGISLVHVNRVVKKLKEDGLLTFERSSIVV